MKRCIRHLISGALGIQGALGALAVVIALVGGAWAPPSQASAPSVDDVLRRIEAQIGIGGRRHGGASLADAHAMIATLEVAPPGLVLAASATAEGHWTFVNQAGERFTTASAREVGQVYRNLARDIKGPPGPVVIYLTGASVFEHAEHLAKLPAGARLRLTHGDRSYPLAAFGEGAKRLWFAEAAAQLFVRTNDRASFEETTWQLARSLKGLPIRVVALDPGGPDTFRPNVRQRDGEPPIDAINPEKLTAALSTLRYQTAVLTGRFKGGDALIYRTPSGIERTLDLPPLRAAAANGDANLIFVNVRAPRQPGARNWLWVTVEVEGLADALRQETLGDFFVRLAGGDGPLFVEARRMAAAAPATRRVRLNVIPMRAGVIEREPGTLSSVLAELVSEVAGAVLTHAVEADLVAMERQIELDRRLVPWIPAWVQLGFGLAVLAGLAGLPVALEWWQRIWPREARREYAGAAGFAAARAVRLAAFGLLFLPVAGLPAMAAAIGRVAWRLAGFRRREAKG